MGKNDSDEHWIGFLGSLNEVQARQLAGLKALEFGCGGRKRIINKDQTIMTDLESLVEPVTRDTSAFAVESIRQWWISMAKKYIQKRKNF